jgi:hypothetical protein
VHICRTAKQGCTNSSTPKSASRQFGMPAS